MLIKNITEAVGVSGREGEIRTFIREELSASVDKFTGDPLGNLYAWKIKEGTPLVMLAAHMDEVGFMVTGIDSNGFLSFSPIGGIDNRVVVGKTVQIGDNKVKGIIGAKPIHLQQPQERQKPFTYRELYIDIGVSGEQEAKSKVKIGDYVAFYVKTEELQENIYKGKAFDDRLGCAAIIEVLRTDVPVSVCGAFTVQEELGLRGAGSAAYNVKPDLALILEGTTASDVPDIKEHLYSTSMGAGPALSVMDRSFLANSNLNQALQDIAKKENIPYQLRRSNTGGTDAGRIHLSMEGIPTAGMAVPCRYIHGPATVMHLDDFNNMVNWVKAMLKEISKGGFPYERTY